jgi:Polymer-forming cytoskeletal
MRLIRATFHLSVALTLVSILGGSAIADSPHDRTQVGRSITVGPDEEVSDVTCFGCGVRVRGHVHGDVTTFGGSVVLEDQAQVDGDLTTFAGSVRLDGGTRVGGDVTVFGGRLRREPSASIGGSVSNMGSVGWLLLLLIVLIPFIVLGGLVALLIWLIQRLTRPSLPARA